MRFVISMTVILFVIASLRVHAQIQPELEVVQVQQQENSGNGVVIGGTVAALKSVALTAQMPGRITWIAGEEGDRFRQGDTLVKINDDELLAQRQNAVAQYYSAYQARNNAWVQLNRQVESRSTTSQTPGGMGLPGMFDQMFTNPMAEIIGSRDFSAERGADIYGRGSQLQQANHAIEQAQAQIQQIDSKLRDTYSVAPFEGTIVARPVEIGDPVQPGQTLLVFEDLSRLQVHVDVPGRLLSKLSNQQQVDVFIDGQTHASKAIVTRIFPTADPVRHTTRVELTLPAGTTATPGNYAEIAIPGSTAAGEQHVLVPASAIAMRGGLPTVFAVNPDNRVELRLVRVGSTLPSGHTVIHYGVSAGERVVNNPPGYLTSGSSLGQ